VDIFEILGLDDEARFNSNHAAAGSSTGGQFTSAGSGGGAVKAAQQKLGLKQTGHASPALIHQLQAAQALSPCGGKTAARESTMVLETRAAPTMPYGNVDYADPGYQADKQKRYPLDTEEHVRAAWSYINQSDNASRYSADDLAAVKKRIMAAGKKYGIEFEGDDEPDNDPDDMGRSARLAVCTRSYNFELREVSRNGRRLVGRVAVFNKRARIPDRGGDFDEETHPGFMDRSLNALGYPVMQFDHGKDPRTGTVPIGVYDDWDGNNRSGYDVAGDLFDNPVVEPIRQAIMGKAVKGMSWRMQVKSDKWERRKGEPDVRHILDADVPEAGPVVFPAYRDTTVSVRSILATFDEDEREELIRELRQQAGLATDLTGRPGTRSAGGGDHDDESWEDEASRTKRIRERIYRTQMLHTLPSD
jgi:phage head maturation protease